MKTPWDPMAEAVARLLSPHAEVVLHDVASDRIVAIWNNLSDRSVGDPSLLGELATLTPSEGGVYGPYPKSLPDGRRLSSVSAVLGDGSMLLCVNFDRTVFDDVSRLLTGFAAPVTAQPQALFDGDWTEAVNDVVGAYVRAAGTPVSRLTRTQRLDVITQLDDLNVFDHRRAVPTVARALQASRSTVYQLLADVRKESGHAS